MSIQVIDPVSGAPRPISGVAGKLITSLPANAAVVTPSDVPGNPGAFFDPPASIWVGDAGPVNVAVVPYGKNGDKSVIYPVSAGMTLPVLVKQVLNTGTTAASLRAQW